jgi:broad specificity phosphatase PhoE
LIGLYLTHPQVEIDRRTAVPDWRLSRRGRERVEEILGRRWLRQTGRIVSSTERKAVETAGLISDALGLPFETASDMGENDRSATGFLEPPAFEKAADRFFAEPDASWNGWERAADAAARIVQAVELVLATHDSRQQLLLVGHGAVGTLLKCRIAGRPISRAEDQSAGGGNLYAFSLADRNLLCDWTPMERFAGVRHGL